MFPTTCPLLQNSYTSSLPPHLLGAVLSELLEMLPLGLEVLKIPAEQNATLNFYVVSNFSVDNSVKGRLWGSS